MHMLLWALLLGQSPAGHYVSDKAIERVEFHDAEPLIGCVGCLAAQGTNNIFRLVQMPLPELSLLLISDHRVLVQGLDYTLRSDGVVEIINIKMIPHDSLMAYYRIEH